MRIFLDTNVLVSAFATRGLAADLFRLVLSEHELVVGEVVLEELERILRRKLRLPDSVVDGAHDVLRRHPVAPHPTDLPADVEIRDPDDLRVLASARLAGAELLVTGDNDLLDVADAVRRPRIVSPRECWETLRGAV